MSLTSEDYASLASSAYNDRDKGSRVSINGHSYKVIHKVADNWSGLHAAAYRQTEPPGGIIIAFRGTDPNIKHHTLTTAQDVLVDATMVAGRINPQETRAREFTQEVLDYAKANGIPLDEITVTGHSLGGTLAEIESWRFGLGGQTFNAYGAAGLRYGIPEGGTRIIDNVLDGDVVSAASPHFGVVRHFATPADIESLRDGGYLGRGLASPLVAARWSDHSIEYFAPPPGQPSVLTAVNEARAREYAEPIARYRQDVYAATRHLHDAAQPEPVRRALGQAAVDGVVAKAGAVYAEHVAEGIAEAAERGTTRGVHAAERAVQEVGQTIDREAVKVRENWSSLVGGVEHDIGRLHPRRLLTDPAHPEHALFQSARSAVSTMQRQGGIKARPEESEHLAAALTVASRKADVQRIDRVVLGDRGRQAFAFEESPYAALKVAKADVREALRTSLAQHSENAAAAHRACQVRQPPAPKWQPEQVLPQAMQHHAFGQ